MGLEHIELVMDLENEFGIRIPDVVVQEIRSVGELYDAILLMVRSHGKESLRRKGDLDAFVWDRLCKLAAKVASGMEPCEITRDTRLIEDLGYG